MLMYVFYRGRLYHPQYRKVGVEMRKEIEDMSMLSFDVVQCAWCDGYFHAKTKKRVAKPAGQTLFSHTICDDCTTKVKLELTSEGIYSDGT